jgi:hypothetical protein
LETPQPYPNKQKLSIKHNNSGKRPVATYIIEFPEEFFYLDQTQFKPRNLSGGYQGDGMEAAQVDSGEASMVLDTMVEGGPVLAPPPLSTLPDFFQVPPPFFHPEQLVLVFEI